MSYKFNPITGKFDYYNDIDAVKRLEELKTLDNTISALKIVTATSDNNVNIATSDDTYEAASSMGVLLNAGTTGTQRAILLFGKLTDNSFSFPVRSILFLGKGGAITDIAPDIASGDTHLTVIGYSLGGNSIFVNIEKPIIL